MMKCKICKKEIEKGKEKYCYGLVMCKYCFEENKYKTKFKPYKPQITWVLKNMKEIPTFTEKFRENALYRKFNRVKKEDKS